MTTKSLEVIDMRSGATSCVYVGSDTAGRFAVAITPLTSNVNVAAVMISEKTLREMLRGLAKRKKK